MPAKQICRPQAATLFLADTDPHTQLTRAQLPASRRGAWPKCLLREITFAEITGLHATAAPITYDGGRSHAFAMYMRERKLTCNNINVTLLTLQLPPSISEEIETEGMQPQLGFARREDTSALGK